MQDTNNIDDYLAEFDQEVPETPRGDEEQPVLESETLNPETDRQIAELNDKVKHTHEFQENMQNIFQEAQEEADKKEMLRAAQDTLKDLHLSDKEVMGRLIGEYATNPIFAEAIDNRASDGDAAYRAISRAADDIRKDYESHLDMKSTDDRAAVLAYVRTVPSNIDETPKFSEMTDAEFAAYERKLRK